MCVPQTFSVRLASGGPCAQRVPCARRVLAMASPGLASRHAIVNVNWKFCRIRVHQWGSRMRDP